MSDVRVFVDGRGLTLPRQATALDAVRADSAQAAHAVERGEMAITDSRGLPIAPESAVAAGTILRTVPVRARRTDGAE
ncbi:MAG TPA: hypothetical protein VFK13_01670 [Gemmatimonadaceae bacterium]|nr:hypothetical protein [Gemmatimonadaceae bacterium]